MLEEDYKPEIQLIGKKAPTLHVTWQVRSLIEQVITPLLPKGEADLIYTKLCEAFKPRAGMRLTQLLKQVSTDSSKGMYRVVIFIKLFRELFANELTGWGGGGGKGYSKIENPLQTTLTRRK